jgi:putative Holliday junction resolvase
MPRILALDYGTKRTGLAVTDPLQIICSPLDTIPTATLMDFLSVYLAEEAVERIVIGEPRHADGAPTHLMPHIERLEKEIVARWPHVVLARMDERFTSKMAERIIAQSGYKKSKRQDKNLVDRVSASIILQYYMESQR